MSFTMSRLGPVLLALLLAGCSDPADCSANGVCNPQCAADPDCGGMSCEADGECNPNCPEGTDEDCGEEGCDQDGNCNKACPAGTDPDCAYTKAAFPGFNSAAGTMKGANYQVTGTLVPGEYGKTATGTSKKAAPGIRNTEKE